MVGFLALQRSFYDVVILSDAEGGKKHVQCPPACPPLGRVKFPKGQ